MRIKKLKFYNVLPFGAKPVELDFEKDANLTLITGSNGAGKSSIPKIIEAGLYLGLTGIKKENIVNNINQGKGYICIWLNNGKLNEDWIVETHWKPFKVKLYRGNELDEKNIHDAGDIPATKKFIEQHLVGYPHYIFNNIINLNFNHFKSFLSMNVKDARKIRDRILGFHIINKMLEEHNESTAGQLKAFEQLETKLGIKKEDLEELQGEYSAEETRVETVKAEVQAEVDERLSQLDEQLEVHTITLEEHQEKKKKLKDEKKKIFSASYVNRMNKALSEMKELKPRYDKAKAKVESGQATKGEIEDVLKWFKHKEVLDEIEELKSKKTNLENSLKNKHTELDVLKTEFEETNSKSDEIKGNIEEWKAGVEYRDLCKSLMESYEKLKTKLEEKKSLAGDIEKGLEQIKLVQKDIRNSEYRIKTSETLLQNLEYERCPTCDSDLTTVDVSEKREELLQEVQKEKHTLGKKKELELSEQKIVDSVNKQLKEIEENIMSLKEDLLPVNRVLKEGQEKSYKSIAENYKEVKDIDYEKKIEEASKLVEEAKEPIDLKQQISQIEDDIRQTESQCYKIEGELSSKQKLEEVEKPESDLLSKDKSELEAEQKELLTEIEDSSTTVKSIVTKVNEAKSQIKVSKEYLTENGLKTDDIEPSEMTMTEVNEKLQASQVKIDHYQAEINNIKVLISSAKGEKERNKDFKGDLELINNKITKYKVEVDELTDQFVTMSKEQGINRLVYHSLTDEGVKSYIIREVVPIINNQIEEVLRVLEVPIECKFDEYFKPQLTRYGVDADLDSISSGQTTMINYAIILAVTLIIYRKYGSINLIVYDEIFANIDAERIPIIIKMVREFCVEGLNMNTFLVNHSPVPVNYFDQFIEVTHKDRFSHVKITQNEVTE